MSQLLSCLRPLSLMRGEDIGTRLEIEQRDPESLPEPYKELLVHRFDMTHTLQNFHQDELHISVLNARHTPEKYTREVILVTDKANIPAEYGVLQVSTGSLAPEIREAVEQNRRPLGAILRSGSMEVLHHPGPWFQLRPDEAIRNALALQSDDILYGRCNRIASLLGTTIAEVVEILPSVSPAGVRA